MNAPWKLSDKHPYNVVDENGNIVASCDHPLFFSLEEMKEHARLITALPDMLAALLEAASLIPVASRLPPQDLFNLQKTIISAIAKATEAP